MELYEVYQENTRTESKKLVESLTWTTGKPSKERVPLEDEIVSKIVNVSRVNLEASFYLSILYLTGSRIAEITPYLYTGKEYQSGNIPNLIKHSIRLKDIWAEEDNDHKQWVYIITRVEKTFKAKKDMPVENRIKKLEKTIYKKQRFQYKEEHPTFPLLRIIETYLERFSDEKNQDKEIIDVSVRTLRNYCYRYLNLNPHLLRHWRCKILVKEYGFNPQDLQKFLGWASYSMPMYYSESEQEIIDRKLSLD